MVEGDGAARPSRASTAAILRPPQAGCAARTASAAASIAGSIRAGLDKGRRDRSATPAGPASRHRASHL